MAIFLFTKYCSCSCKRAMKSVPGVEGKKDCDEQTELFTQNTSKNSSKMELYLQYQALLEIHSELP